MPQAPQRRFADRRLADGIMLEDTRAVSVAPVVRDRGDGRQVDLLVPVEIPEFWLRHIGVVRRGEGDRQEKRLALRLAGLVVEPADRLELHLVVVIDLQGAGAGAGLQHILHVLEPHLGFGLGPVRGPAEVGGVDVRGQAFLIAVQLVGPGEMHLAAQAGEVARQAQIVREGRRGGGELRRVVIGAHLVRQQTRHHGKPRRPAERRIAIGCLEEHAFLRQPAEGRRPHHRVPVKGHGLGAHLVGHDEKNVGLGRAVGHGFRSPENRLQQILK